MYRSVRQWRTNQNVQEAHQPQHWPARPPPTHWPQSQLWLAAPKQALRCAPVSAKALPTVAEPSRSLQGPGIAAASATHTLAHADGLQPPADTPNSQLSTASQVSESARPSSPSLRRKWHALDDKEVERRMRISEANAGKTPWNKGRKHTPETIEKIRERTRQAMLRPEVLQAYKDGVAKSLEKKAELRKDKPPKPTVVRAPKPIKYPKCEFDDAPADGASCWDPQQARSRCGSGTVYAQRQLQRRAAAGGCGLWQSAEGWHGDGWEDTVLHTDVELKTRKRTSSPSKVKVIKADRQQTTESDASQLDGGSQSTGPKKRRPPSEEHKRAIAEAIRAKWQDPEYRSKTVSAIQIKAKSRPPPAKSASPKTTSKAKQPHTQADQQGVDGTAGAESAGAAAKRTKKRSAGASGSNRKAGVGKGSLSVEEESELRRLRELRLSQLQAIATQVVSTRKLLARLDLNIEAMRVRVVAFKNDRSMAARAALQVSDAEATMALAQLKLTQLHAQLPPSVTFSDTGRVTVKDAAAFDAMLLQYLHSAKNSPTHHTNHHAADESDSEDESDLCEGEGGEGESGSGEGQHGWSGAHMEGHGGLHGESHMHGDEHMHGGAHMQHGWGGSDLPRSIPLPGYATMRDEHSVSPTLSPLDTRAPTGHHHHANGHTVHANGHSVTGDGTINGHHHANGFHANGHHVNGHDVNGYSNGHHVNGYHANGHSNGHSASSPPAGAGPRVVGEVSAAELLAPAGGNADADHAAAARALHSHDALSHTTTNTHSGNSGSGSDGTLDSSLHSDLDNSGLLEGEDPYDEFESDGGDLTADEEAAFELMMRRMEGADTDIETAIASHSLGEVQSIGAESHSMGSEGDRHTQGHAAQPALPVVVPTVLPLAPQVAAMSAPTAARRRTARGSATPAVVVAAPVASVPVGASAGSPAGGEFIQSTRARSVRRS